MNEKLTLRQELFVLEFIKDLNATQAAIRAGYSKSGAQQEGSRQLSNAVVQAAIAKAMAERMQRVQVDADFVLRELLAIARLDLAEVYDEAGNLKPIHDMPPHARKAIAGIEAVEEWSGKGKDRSFVGYTKKLKLWDKTKALEMLGRHLALFTDRLDVNMNIDLAQRLVEGRRRTGGRS